MYRWQWWCFHPVTAGFATTACLVALRLYLNYFDIQYANAIISSEWKSILNPHSRETNWFILNRRRYGTLRFWYIPIAILVVFNIVGGYIWETPMLFPGHSESNLLSLYQTTSLQIYNLVLCLNMNRAAKQLYMNMTGLLVDLICIVAVVIIRCKTPEFHDIFYQRHEIIMLIRPSVVAVTYIIAFLGTRELWPSEGAKAINDLFIYLVFASLSAWIVYTTTLGVIRKNKGWFKLKSASLDVFHASFESGDIIPTPHGDASRMRAKSEAVKMHSLLSGEDGFESFMFHLAQVWKRRRCPCCVDHHSI